MYEVLTGVNVKLESNDEIPNPINVWYIFLYKEIILL